MFILASNVSLSPATPIFLQSVTATPMKPSLDGAKPSPATGMICTKISQPADMGYTCIDAADTPTPDTGSSSAINPLFDTSTDTEVDPSHNPSRGLSHDRVTCCEGHPPPDIISEVGPRDRGTCS